MRANGIEEAYITGDKSDYEKFLAWAKTVPNTFGNPLYHWTHLELLRYFDIDQVLNEETAPAIWEEANKKLATSEMRSEEHTSELQSRGHLVCRLLLEKKKNNANQT